MSARRSASNRIESACVVCDGAAAGLYVEQRFVRWLLLHRSNSTLGGCAAVCVLAGRLLVSSSRTHS